MDDSLDRWPDGVIFHGQNLLSMHFISPAMSSSVMRVPMSYLVSLKTDRISTLFGFIHSLSFVQTLLDRDLTDAIVE